MTILRLRNTFYVHVRVWHSGGPDVEPASHRISRRIGAHRDSLWRLGGDLGDAGEPATGGHDVEPGYRRIQSSCRALDRPVAVTVSPAGEHVLRLAIGLYAGRHPRD